jgi:ferredoxin
MIYVITRLCRDCVDGACVDTCPVDCILEHRPAEGPSDLPRQLFIDPDICIGCGACEPACPWEAISEESDVPARFREDIALNVLASTRNAEFHVPVQRLLRGATRDEVDENKRRWGILP